jgi:antitoxin (DNA-binding transcriptional repressor) of toxin-antitoxin stability system
MVKYKIRGKKARLDRLGKDKRIAATEAAKTFGRLVNRVREERATYIIERSGTPVAQIGPVEPKIATMRDLAEFFRTAPRLDEETLRYIEAGMAMFNRPTVPKNPWAR